VARTRAGEDTLPAGQIEQEYHQARGSLMNQPLMPVSQDGFIAERRPGVGELSAPTANKIFELLRAEISYEVNLITQRTSLFVGSQAFFFTSLGIALNRSAGTELSLRNSLLFPLIPWVALVVCLVTLVAVVTGFWAALQARAALIRLRNVSDLAAFFPYRSWTVILGGMLPSISLPILFGVAWLFILLGIV
jgi:hypothetical protein